MSKAEQVKASEPLNMRQRIEFIGGTLVGSIGVIGAQESHDWGYVVADVGAALLTALVVEKAVESVKSQNQEN
jgi:hypothetical protein